VSVYSHSSGHPHAAHPVGEAMRPQGRDVVLLDLHLVALEVRELKQADLVLQVVLHTETTEEDRGESERGHRREREQVAHTGERERWKRKREKKEERRVEEKREEKYTPK